LPRAVPWRRARGDAGARARARGAASPRLPALRRAGGGAPGSRRLLPVALTRRRAAHYLSARRFAPRGTRARRPLRYNASLLLSALLVATSARCADGPDALSVESLPERFAAPGEPGFVSDLHMGAGLPFAYLGLVAGGVSLRDGLLPATRPWPGIQEI